MIRWIQRRTLSLVVAPVVALTCAVSTAQAQTPALGDGLAATYYDGQNFERLVQRRHDARLSFDWAMRPPVAGLQSEFFSVRWQGWLVPPATGRYVFHVAVDDGMRIWLNNRLVFDEWRLQPLAHFSFAVELKAGEPYQLRVDYFQNIVDTRASITWERPDVTTASWRNFWGLRTDAPSDISTHFLFTTLPKRVVSPTPVVAARPVTKRVPTPAPPQRSATTPAVAPVRRPAPRPQPVVASRPQPIVTVPVPPVRVAADSGGAARLARLHEGESVTLSELHFDQSQSRLLPAARKVLDKLAADLVEHSTLRLEVQGHTDNQGSAELNRQLSQQRAEVVCLYLSAHGVAANRLLPKGYGGTQPIANNDDAAQRPRNRRVVLLPQP